MNPGDRLDAPEDVTRLLEGTGYLCSSELAAVVSLAMKMHRSLLLEGEPGTGKTASAEAVATAWQLALLRLHCYEGVDAT